MIQFVCLLVFLFIDVHLSVENGPASVREEKDNVELVAAALLKIGKQPGNTSIF